MQRDVATPLEYLAAVPAGQRPLFVHLRALIQSSVPTLREGIRWGMLCYEDAGALFALAAQQHYVGLYVMATDAVKDMAADLEKTHRGGGRWCGTTGIAVSEGLGPLPRGGHLPG